MIRKFKAVTIPGKVKCKLPPIIVIPKKSPSIQPKGGSCISLLNKRVYSKTPHPHVSVSIQRLLEKCSNFWDYTIIRAPDVFMITSSSPDLDETSVKKSEALEQILKVLSDPLQRKACGFESLLQLDTFLKKQLFHPIPVLPSENEFDEKQTTYTVTNWTHIELSYQIMEALIRDVDVSGTFVSLELVKDLVDMFMSPVREEQQAVERILKLIFESYPALRKSLLRFLHAKVMVCIEGEKIPGMASILRLFTHYFENYVDHLTQTHMLLFKTTFFPLFGTSFVARFDKALGTLVSFFCERDSALGLWCLRYLVSHFPVQSSGKQAVFLKQIENVLPVLPRTAMGEVSNEMASFISKCLMSSALLVIMPTLVMVNSPGFSGLLRSCDEKGQRALVAGLKTAARHWKKEIAELAQQILSNVDTQGVNSGRNDERESVWRMIRKTAMSG